MSNLNSIRVLDGQLFDVRLKALSGSNSAVWQALHDFHSKKNRYLHNHIFSNLKFHNLANATMKQNFVESGLTELEHFLSVDPAYNNHFMHREFKCLETTGPDLHYKFIGTWVFDDQKDLLVVLRDKIQDLVRPHGINAVLISVEFQM